MLGRTEAHPVQLNLPTGTKLGKSNLGQYKRAVQEGVKYSRRQCDHKVTSKGDLNCHKRAVH